MPCILPDTMKDFKKYLQESKLGFAGLRKLTSQERIDLFAKHFNTYQGDKTAEWFNREYERKLLLSNQRERLQEWARNLQKKGKKTKNFQLLYEKIAKMKDVYNPKTGRPFLEGLSKAQLGYEISAEDSRAIFELSKTIESLKTKLDKIAGKDYNKLSDAEHVKLSENSENADMFLKYGLKILEFNEKMEEAFFKRYKPNFFEKISGTLTALKASVDLSFGRQLLKGAYVNRADAITAWKGGFSALNKEKARTLKALIYSHPYYTSGKIKEIGVELGGQESEFFPKNFITEVSSEEAETALGRIFKRLFEASERSYEIGVLYAKFLMSVEAINNENGNIESLKAMKIGDAINGLFGKVDIPLIAKENQRKLTMLLFAPRWVASQVRNLMDLRFAVNKFRAKVSDKITYTRAQQMRLKSATTNIIMTVVLSNMISAFVKSLDDKGSDEEWANRFWDSLEEQLNPLSTDFGKIKIGDLRLDLSLGTNAIIQMLSRVATGKTKTGEGLIKKQERIGAVWNWIKYKQSPVIADITLLGKLVNNQISGDPITNAVGQELSPVGVAMQALAPISVQNIVDAVENGKPTLPYIASATTQILADIFGINSSMYDASDKPRNTGKTDDILAKEIAIAKNNPTPSGYSTTTPSSVIAANSVLSGNKKAELEFTKEFLKQEKRYLDSVEYKRDNWEKRNKKIKSIRAKTMAKLKKKYVAKKRKKK